jgi:hypothetical protein
MAKNPVQYNILAVLRRIAPCARTLPILDVLATGADRDLWPVRKQ